VIINFLTLLWYNPRLDQDVPSWVYVSWAVGLFLYQTFDAVDGAQAYVAISSDTSAAQWRCPFLLMYDIQAANASKWTAGRAL
jgi:hypothetical protein